MPPKRSITLRGKHAKAVKAIPVAPTRSDLLEGIAYNAAVAGSTYAFVLDVFDAYTEWLIEHGCPMPHDGWADQRQAIEDLLAKTGALVMATDFVDGLQKLIQEDPANVPPCDAGDTGRPV